MNALTYAAVRANLAATMAAVCDNHDPLIITRRNAESVVLLSLDDYNALCETSYLLSNKNNALRLMESIDELNNGNGIVRALVE